MRRLQPGIEYAISARAVRDRMRSKLAGCGNPIAQTVLSASPSLDARDILPRRRIACSRPASGQRVRPTPAGVGADTVRTWSRVVRESGRAAVL